MPWKEPVRPLDRLIETGLIAVGDVIEDFTYRLYAVPLTVGRSLSVNTPALYTENVPPGDEEPRRYTPGYSDTAIRDKSLSVSVLTSAESNS